MEKELWQTSCQLNNQSADFLLVSIFSCASAIILLSMCVADWVCKWVCLSVCHAGLRPTNLLFIETGPGRGSGRVPAGILAGIPAEVLAGIPPAVLAGIPAGVFEAFVRPNARCSLVKQKTCENELE